MKVSHAVLDNKYRIVFSEPPTQILLDEVISEFTYPNPEYEQAVKRSAGRFKVSAKIPETIRTVAIRKVRSGLEIVVPRGAQRRLDEVLGVVGVVVRDDTTTGVSLLASPLEHLPPFGVKLRDYQIEQVEVGVANRTCLWRAPPGSGKTTAALALVARLKVPAIVVVPNEKIFDQWVQRAETELGLRPRDIGMLSGSHEKRLGALTVAMFQTLANRIETCHDSFGLVIADEVQRHGADSLFQTTDLFTARWRIGISGDERRADRKEFLVYDLFGEVRHEVKRESLIEEGSLVDAKIVVLPVDTRLRWYEGLEPRLRAQPHVQQKLIADLAKDESRNATIEDAIAELAAMDVPTLVMTSRIEHAHRIHAMAVRRAGRAGIMVGAKSKAERRQFDFALEAMRTGDMRVAIGTYQAVGVGFDLPALAGGVFAMPCANSSKSRMQFDQYCGRYERPHPSKSDGSTLFYLWDHFLFGVGPLKNVSAWRKNVVVRTPSGDVPARAYLKSYQSSTYGIAKDDTAGGVFR
jgi:superfamily II DNA or RNA helicase